MCKLVHLPTCQLANLQQAAYYYNRYHELAPDDLLSLKRLAEVCTALEQAGVEDEGCCQAVLYDAEDDESDQSRRWHVERFGAKHSDAWREYR